MYLSMSSSSDELLIVASETDIQRKLRGLARMAEILLARIDNGSYRRQKQLAAIERIRAGDTNRCHTWESTVKTYDERKRPAKNTTFCACCRRKQVPESPHYARCKTPSMKSSSVFRSNMVTCHDTSEASIDAPGGCCNQKRTRPELEHTELDEFSGSESSDGVACSDPKCKCKTRENLIQVVSLQQSVKATQSTAKIDEREINLVEKGVSAQKSMEAGLIFPGNISATQSRNLHGSSRLLDLDLGQDREDEEDETERKEAGMLENFGSECHVDKSSTDTAPEETFIHENVDNSMEISKEEIKSTDLQKKKDPCDCDSDIYYRSSNYQKCKCSPPPQYDSSGNKILPIYEPDLQKAGAKKESKYRRSYHSQKHDESGAHQLNRVIEQDSQHEHSNCACSRKPARVGPCPKKHPHNQENVIVCGPVKRDEASSEPKVCCPPKMKPAKAVAPKQICPSNLARRSRSLPVNSDSALYCNESNYHKNKCGCKPHESAEHAQTEMAYPCYKPKYSPQASPRACLQKSPCQVCFRSPCKKEPVQKLDKMKCQICNKPKVKSQRCNEPKVKCQRCNEPKIKCHACNEPKVKCQRCNEPKVKCHACNEPKVKCERCQKPKVKCQICNKPKVYPQQVPECPDNYQRYEQATTAHGSRRCKRCNQNVLPEKLQKTSTCEARKNHEDKWMRSNRCKCKPHESDKNRARVKPKDTCKARSAPERCQRGRDSERCNRQIEQKRDEHTCRRKIHQNYLSVRPNNSHWTEVKPPSKMFDTVERRHAKCRRCPDSEDVDHRRRGRK